MEIIKIPGGLPAIIDENTFNTIAKRMRANKSNACNKAKETYLLSGKIYCASCGAAMVGHTSYAGRNKSKYSTYRCGTRYRTKGCAMKSIEKSFVEDMVLTELIQNVFNPISIEILVGKLVKYYNKLNSKNLSELKSLEKKLIDIQKEINNIVEAIAKGMFHISLKEKMDVLELEKNKITTYINEIKFSMDNTQLNERLIHAYLMQDLYIIQNKSANELKTLINTYVDSVIVHEDKVDINLHISFVHMYGGGEGCRTPQCFVLVTALFS